MNQFVVITGNPAAGFKFIGPFTNPHHAAEWADEWVPSADYWVSTLTSSTEFENEINKNG